MRASAQRYADAQRACAVYSRESFNWSDCMWAHHATPGEPPRLQGWDGPDCRESAKTSKP